MRRVIANNVVPLRVVRGGKEDAPPICPVRFSATMKLDGIDYRIDVVRVLVDDGAGWEDAWEWTAHYETSTIVKGGDVLLETVKLSTFEQYREPEEAITAARRIIVSAKSKPAVRRIGGPRA